MYRYVANYFILDVNKLASVATTYPSQTYHADLVSVYLACLVL